MVRQIELFWGTSDIYSQFHPCQFTIDDVTYNCCEQFMMHQKALLFQDYDIAEQIMNETKPKTIKSFGRKVKNFDDDLWTEQCRDIVYKGNYAKFSQNEEYRKILLSTGDKLIAEASPYDKRYGIGLGKNDKRSLDPKQWKGKNWLGEAIMKVREKLVEEGG